jgi:hypothetical protein
MITNSKISTLQEKIKSAIEQIAKEENVKIEFGTISFNVSQYRTTMTVTTLEKNEKIDSVQAAICRSLGFTQNVIDMTFKSSSGDFKIVDIKTKNRKYPVIAENVRTGKRYKWTTDQIKRLIGGDKIINRNANLDKLIND